MCDQLTFVALPTMEGKGFLSYFITSLFVKGKIGHHTSDLNESASMLIESEAPTRGYNLTTLIIYF